MNRTLVRDPPCAGAGARSAEPRRPSARCALLCDFHPGNLAGLLENDEAAPAVTTATPGFGDVLPPLLDAGHEVWTPPPDAAVIWTRPEAVLPSFARALEHRLVDEAELLAEVDAFAAAVLGAAPRARLVLVPSWVTAGRGWGLLDLRRGVGVAQLLMRANLRLCERLEGARNVFVLDAGRWVAAAGKRAFEPRLAFMAKVPFGNAVFAAAVAEIKAALRAASGQARKLVIVDLDDTLWGGVVGDVGWEGLRLGGHDAVGEAHVAFQRGLLALRNRGVLLAVASKNDEAVALEAIDRHPEMVLRRRDLSAWRISWGDKARAIAELAAELNLGLQSVVFLDDHPVERARVREALPEVLVPELPETLLLPSALAALDCFDTPQVTGEDLARADMMAAGRARDAARAQVGSLADWLRGLETRVTIAPLARPDLARAAQLLNKTNQMNLRTRRLTEDELWAWSQERGRVLTVRVADRFGDAGLTGLLGLAVDGATASVEDFVLSCRVMGRKVEELMLHAAVETARAAGAARVIARPLPTAKNGPCLDFFRRCGWSGDEHGYEWDARVPYPRPAEIL